MVGTVKSIIVDRGFGFIAVPGEDDVFFHYRGLCGGLEFNEQLVERRVRFNVIESEKGPRAGAVRPAD